MMRAWSRNGARPGTVARDAAAKEMVTPMSELIDAVRAAPRSAARPLPGVRVLVAEDHREIQKVTATLLDLAGADVTLAANGRAACDLALAARDAGRPFDLVLMDMQMPVLDGYEATRLLRAWGLTTPIVAVTAHADPDDRAECLAIGCDAHVAKPVDWPALLALLANLVADPRDGS
jgi:CheY-like chemotaxis protein